MATSYDQVVAALRAALTDVRDLRKQNEMLRSAAKAADEPVAIVAMGCRLPGGVASGEDLWQLLMSGTDAITGFPTDRGWDVADLYDPNPDATGKMYVRDGGFLHDAPLFDAELFRISPREAAAMDPQQRVLLETAWEVFEHAGIPIDSVSGSRTGVYVGSFAEGYGEGAQQVSDGSEGYLITGTASSVASGRLSYSFGLEGPAVTIDTACSSSLVAMHQAVQALRRGECDLALAGGVTVLANPGLYVEFSRQRGLAPDGRCKSFAAAADGTAFSEGAGLLLLQRLSEAQRDNHPILAVIRGSAVNQDGASNGLTAPNGPSQQRVIRAALVNAGLTPDDVDVVEAHGTGTTLGDPVEAQALLDTYGRDRSADQPLWLGSLKSNIGHTQAAAGVAGVIKMVLAMHHDMLPKTLHVDTPTPHVDWDAGAISLLTEPTAWPSNGKPRRAGISAFGISGTNAHLIIEEPPIGPSPAVPSPDAATAAPSRTGPWVLSGRTEAQLRAQAAKLRDYVAQHPDLALGDLGFSLATSRARFEHRAAVTGADRVEFLDALTALAENRPAGGVVTGMDLQGKTVFVFPGQGAQWLGMGRELLDSSPVFAQQIAACAAALAEFVDWPLVDVLTGADDTWLERVDVVQPALWAVMIGLAEVWRSYGVRPAAVVGHSQGEIAAAVVAGALSLADGARVVALRSKALRALAGRGGMASVGLSRADAQRLVEEFAGRLSVAAVNGAGATVVSGDTDALVELSARCEDEQIRFRRISVDYASHSAHVEELADQLLAVLAPIEPRSADVPFYSTVTGAVLDTAELDAGYWYRNLRGTVCFEQATTALLSAGHLVFVECSPHPVLTMAIAETIDAAEVSAATVESLLRDRGGPAQLRAALGRAHVQGVDVDWSAVFPGAGRVALPTYAFTRQRFWLESVGAAPAGASALGLGAIGHPLLGAEVSVAAGGPTVLTGRLSVDRQPWLADHQVDGRILLPGTAFVEIALRAGDAVGCDGLDELVLNRPLVVPADLGVTLQAVVETADADGRYPLHLYSRVDDGIDREWLTHASGFLVADGVRAADVEAADDATSWPPTNAQPVDIADCYADLARRGYQYGPTFRGLRAVWRRGGEIFAEVALPNSAAGDVASYGVHPALLDAALHPMLVVEEGNGELALPFSWSGVTLHATGAAALRVRLNHRGPDELELSVADSSGAPVASVRSLRVRAATTRQLPTRAVVEPEALYGLDWKPLPIGEGRAGTANWAVVGTDAASLISTLRATGVVVAEYPTLDRLRHAMTSGSPAPEIVVLLPAVHVDQDAMPDTVRETLNATLAVLQSWLADDRFDGSKLVVVTDNAVSVDDGPAVAELAAATVWGLLRSAQAENPGRFQLVDLDGTQDSARVLRLVAMRDEPEVAIRLGKPATPRLVPAGRRLERPEDRSWRLELVAKGSLDGLALVDHPAATATLGPDDVRVAVHAAGVNFHDVVVAVGLFDDPRPLGSEAAGVVVETGANIDDVRPGDRVMGLFFTGAFGSLAVTDRRLLVKIPSTWSFTQAASVPTVYATALWGLTRLAGLRAGQRVLIHAAAGGVGMAAVQIARHIGAEVFATASPSKWDALRALGLTDDHLASSRTPAFEAAFADAGGMDVVLNSLAGEFVDASLRLVRPGGHFLEIGRTDIRTADSVERDHPGVSYTAFDLQDAADSCGELLTEAVDLFERGVYQLAPIAAWSVERAADAFRFMSMARHVGKLVLNVRAPMSEHGTVALTGASGALAGLVARHLATVGGVRHLLLLSRTEPAAELVQELVELGVEATWARCDVADRAALRRALAAVSPDHPLTGVMHLAGVLDDGLVETLTPSRLDTVLRPKVDGAWNLHVLTKDLPLTDFVLFSSAAGTLGNPGQAGYGAANSFLDALVTHRRRAGLPGTSLAWGWWADTGSRMTGTLDDAGFERLRELGLVPITGATGMRMLDDAMAADQALVLPIDLDPARLRANARALGVPPLLRRMAGATGRKRAATGTVAGGGMAREVAAMDRRQARATVTRLVSDAVASVLGYRDSTDLPTGTALRELGFDSLTSVELRNRLNAATGLRLPTTLVFDHPTVDAIVRAIEGEFFGAKGDTVPTPGQRTMPADDDPVVIVGMGCHYPGGVGSPEQLWDLVVSGGDAMSAFPTDRGWDLTNLFDADPDASGKSYTRVGGFLDDATGFDADLFGISPREAAAMDPQQRLVLETAWETFERAGMTMPELRGSRTGVFVGAISQGYGEGAQNTPDAEGYLVTGTTTSVVSGRVAYVFGLEGPAVSVDTACSSSLVALHLAVQSLRGGECDMALAGGVTVMAAPTVFIEFSRQRGLAGDGRCKAYAEAADGTGFSEGAGLVLLERLSDARRHGHRVLAVVRGSAVNQDGASNGMSAPNGPSQQRVIRAALANAGLTVDDVDAVEGHGTGTTLGDPIEAQALLATYGRDRDPDRPLWLGSLKSNIGHAQAAAGVAGVIKMVLALRHAVLPATLHVDVPSAQVDWEDGAVSLLTERREWSAGNRTRRAGVSAFGISGTNAHLILEQAPAPPAVVVAAEPARRAGRATPGAGDVAVWLVSGRTEAALREQARRVRAVLADSEHDVVAAARELAGARTHLEHRAAVIGERGRLLAGLDAVAAGRTSAGVVAGVARPVGTTVFVFSGQGSQWPGMAVELAAAAPVFAQHLQACADVLDPLTGWSLSDLLAAGDDAMPERADIVQPALFAVQTGLATLWMAAGVMPDAVIGHSQGEIAAAYIAGALSLADAAKIVALRSRALTAIADQGGMVSVSQPLSDVERLVARWPDRVSVAAVNGPAAIVVSGDTAALAELLQVCDAEGIRARRVQVDYASHCPQVEPLRAEIMDALADIRPRTGDIAFCSTVTGDIIDTARLDAEYWYTNLRSPVLFRDAVERLARQGRRPVFIETSPHPMLTAATQDLLDESDADGVALATLRRDDGGQARFLDSAARAHILGVTMPDVMAPFVPTDGVARVDEVELPTYSFQHQRYWLDPVVATGDAGELGLTQLDHPVLGAVIELPDGQGELFTGRLSVADQPWLADHAFHGAVLVPAAVFVEMVAHAAGRVGFEMIDTLRIEQPLTLSPAEALSLRLVVGSAAADGRRPVTLDSRPSGSDDAWTRHATGVLGHRVEPRRTDIGQWPPVSATGLDVAEAYWEAAALGFDYGPAGRGITAAWRDGATTLLEVALPEVVGPPAGARPALLAAAMQPAVLGALVASWPNRWAGVDVAEIVATSLRVRVTQTAESTFALDIADETGTLVGQIESVALQALPTDSADNHDADAALFAVDWQQVEPGRPQGRRWALLGADTDEIAEQLRTVGIEVTQVETAADPAVGDLPDALVIVAGPPPTQADPAATAREAVRALADTLSQLPVEDRSRGALIVVTHSAVAVAPDESTADPAAAAVWGLATSAQAADPGRIVLVDLDSQVASIQALPGLVETGPAQLAIRDGVGFAARLVAVDEDLTAEAPADGRRSLRAWPLRRKQVTGPQPDPKGTVLITGTAGVAPLLARHVATAWGAKHLLVAVPQAQVSSTLRAELATINAHVDVFGCDLAGPGAVGTLLGAVGRRHPLTAVIHAMGLLEPDLGAVPDTSVEVLRQVVDAAWQLHEHTRQLDLAAFLLLSSPMGAVGAADHGTAAAASAFLSGLALHRRRAGLTANAVAWSTGAADATGLFGAVTADRAPALLDLACRLDRAQLLAAEFRKAALYRVAGEGRLPRVLDGLVRPPTTFEAPAERPTLRTPPPPRPEVVAEVVSSATGTLAEQVAAASADDARVLVLEQVYIAVATVLGRDPVDAEIQGRNFSDLGFDSLAAMRLRKELDAATGMRLPATLAYDHPTAGELADYLLSKLDPTGATPKEPLQQLAELESALLVMARDDADRPVIGARLRSLTARIDGTPAAGPAAPADVRIQDATVEELFAIIDNELGRAHALTESGSVRTRAPRGDDAAD